MDGPGKPIGEVTHLCVMPDFEEGDVVELKSGGPTMTVEGSNRGRLICSWFDGEELEREMFKPGALKSAD